MVLSIDIKFEQSSVATASAPFLQDNDNDRTFEKVPALILPSPQEETLLNKVLHLFSSPPSSYVILFSL